jgi:23S rRNA pseudouridine955/2504/2580 synthase
VEAGQIVRVPPAEPPAAPKARPEKQSLSADQISYVNEMVIHRDPAAIVVNKPPGLATQGGTGMTTHLDGLLDGLADDKGVRPKLVHRLDKDTSGVLLLARTARSAAFFSKAFSGRTARKVYWAVVAGVPSIDDGIIELPIAKQPGTGGEKMHVDEEEGLAARTRYRVIDQAGNRGSSSSRIPAVRTSSASIWRRSDIRSSGTANMAVRTPSSPAISAASSISTPGASGSTIPMASGST